MLRLHLVSLSALILAAFAAAANFQQPAEQAIVKVTAEELGREFEKDTDAAVKKYLPPKAGTTGGVLITITGVVAQVDGKNNEVGLNAGANSRVVLHAKKVAGVKAGDTIKVEHARFRTYFRRTILIDCDEVRPAK